MTTSEAPAGRRWRRIKPLPAFVVLVCTAILLALGTWQVQRFGLKNRQAAQIAALQSAPAEPLNVVLNRLGDRGDVNWVRVQTLCPALQQGPTLSLYAIVDGVAGQRSITACPVSSGPYRTILVDRGFTPQERVNALRPGPVLDVPITGVLRRPDRKTWITPPNQPGTGVWRWRDVPAMAAALHASSPAPVMLMLERPAPPRGLPAPTPLPPQIVNNSLGYAITWYGLAVGLVAVWIASLRQPRAPTGRPQP